MDARVVTVVLCLGDGTVLGSLAPFEVEVPWWPEVEPVVRGVRERHGVEITVLRLLHADGRGSLGGAVTYLAEVESRPAVELLAWGGPPLADDPLRQTYARPGGPRRDLAWADAALAAHGTPRTAPAIQVRTWNLSSVWRLPIGPGQAWLKVVPPFFAHEGAILARLDPDVVPPLIASDGPRVLLGHVPGEDLHRAAEPLLRRMVDLLVGLQVQWAARTRELVEVGAPDWRGDVFGALARDAVARTPIDAATRRRVEALVDGLPQRFAELAACGLPDTLVHGDFHPGNTRGGHGHIVLLDWGDCGLGHPLLDQAAFLERLADPERAALSRHWAAAWRAAVAGSDPDRAARLVAPIAALRQAVMYRTILDRIEPAERVYHAADPLEWLAQAAALSSAS